MPAIFRSAGRHFSDPAVSKLFVSTLRIASWGTSRNENVTVGGCGCSECSSQRSHSSSSGVVGGHGPHCSCNSCSVENPGHCVVSLSCQCPRCAGLITSISGPALFAGMQATFAGMHSTKYGAMVSTANHGSRGLHSARSYALQLNGTRQCCSRCQQAPCACTRARRAFSTDDQHQAEIDTINEAFVTARDEIEYAKEEAETVYFNEAHETAKEAVADTLQHFQALLDSLEESERSKLQRSMGLKMEQLKAELEVLDSLHA